MKPFNPVVGFPEFQWSIFFGTVAFRAYWLLGLVFCLTVFSFTTVQAANPTLITFSEYPTGTTITDRYDSLGIRFSSYEPNVPHIRADTEFPSSPVLTANDEFSGSVTAEFIDPANTSEMASAINVSFDMGPCVAPGHLGVWYADVNGNFGFF